MILRRVKEKLARNHLIKCRQWTELNAAADAERLLLYNCNKTRRTLCQIAELL